MICKSFHVFVTKKASQCIKTQYRKHHWIHVAYKRISVDKHHLIGFFFHSFIHWAYKSNTLYRINNIFSLQTRFHKCIFNKFIKWPYTGRKTAKKWVTFSIDTLYSEHQIANKFNSKYFTKYYITTLIG